MLSEQQIENLIQPVINRQQSINLYVLQKIANRIKEIGSITESDRYSLERLYKSGSDVQQINKKLAELTGLQVAEIKNIIKEIAYVNYIDMKPFFDYRQKPFIPFTQNKALQNVIRSIANQTANTYINMSKSQAFMIRDLKNPKILRPTSVSQTYQTVLDEAIQASQQGTVDYGTAMRKTLKQLIDSGIRYVEYNTESGRRYTQRLDTAVRRNLLDGIRAINQGVQDEVGKQFDADGKEISVHANSALDHEPVQGHQFTNEEYEKLQNAEPFQDINGNKFSPIERAMGTLNCRHFSFSIIIGVSDPVYTQNQLDAFIKKNHEGYTLPNGKHLTMYDCTQYQRQLETKVREAKDGQIVARQAGDIDLARQYQAKINKWTTEYLQFSKACGLTPMKQKMSVSGYHRISIK